jgi:hypothetical protein
VVDDARASRIGDAKRDPRVNSLLALRMRLLISNSYGRRVIVSLSVSNAMTLPVRSRTNFAGEAVLALINASPVLRNYSRRASFSQSRDP